MNKSDYILIGLGTVLMLLGILYLAGIIANILAVLFFGLCVFFVLAMIILALIGVISLPYYTVKKKPKTQEQGNYDLEDFK